MDDNELVLEYENILLYSDDNQEKYMACLDLYFFYKEHNNIEKGLFYCVKSYSYDPQQVEGIYYLILHYLWNENASLAYQYYLLIKENYENKNLLSKWKNHIIHDFFLPYHMIFVSNKTGNYETALQMIKLIFTTKTILIDHLCITHFLQNIQFFIQYISEKELSIFSTLFLEYIAFLKENNYSFENHDFLSQNEYKKLGLHQKQNKYAFFVKLISECPILTLYEVGRNNEEWEVTCSLLLHDTTTHFTIHKIPSNEMIYDHYVLHDLLNPQMIKLGEDCNFESIQKNIDMISRSKYIVIDCEYEREIERITLFLVNNEDWVLCKPSHNEQEKTVFYFTNKKHNDGYSWIFYIPKWFNNSLRDYFNGLASLYKGIDYTTDANQIYASNPNKVTFILCFENKDLIKYCAEHEIQISILNTEPLNIPLWMKTFLNNIVNFPNVKIYDYSRSNIQLFSEIGIHNVEHLSYFVSEKEKQKLITFKTNTEKLYDFGIISHVDPIPCERRKKIVDCLRAFGYNVCVVMGWEDKRDVELSKCKIILNIHGWYTTETRIFEHIRCDRLLYSGYNIISEESLFLNEAFQKRFSNLIIISYNDFLNLDTYTEVSTPTANKIQEWLS